jgi:bleomycin hydrolase
MRFFIYIVCFIFFLPLNANDPEVPSKETYSCIFFDQILIPSTHVKNQQKTGTCWSFATLSFIESELLRKTNISYDISEMFIVRNVYLQKAEKYIRMHGTINFGAGGEPNDVLNAIDQFGLMPEEAYSGLLNDSLSHYHYDMDRDLKEYVDSIVRNNNAEHYVTWKTGFNKILDGYLGAVPDSFKINGKYHTSRSFASSLPIESKDYIFLSSFTHHPFYQSFILEVPDNWSWGAYQNLPINELEEVVDSALQKGYSLGWAADYSEDGFMGKSGLVIAPEVLYVIDSENEWSGLMQFPKEKRDSLFSDLRTPVTEIEVTQEQRQQAFDNYATQDDHSMHIIGLASDKNGKQYYKVKNSWGSAVSQEGYLYVSKAYFRYKTISILVHKDALPQRIIGKFNQ